MTNLQRSIISLSTGANLIVIHNLQWFGQNIDAALENWLARRSTDFLQGNSPEVLTRDFCNYIMSKDVNFKAMTGIEYELLKNSKKC